MQDKYKDIICTNFSLVIKHEPSQIEQILKLYIEYNWLKNFAINYDATRNIKIIFIDDSSFVFDRSGKIVMKSFKKKKEA
jgi:hypothetical protein